MFRFLVALFSVVVFAQFVSAEEPIRERIEWADIWVTDADKEALIEAWKKYHRTAMEKEVMSTIFDDGQAEIEAEMQRMKQRIAMQTAMAQGTSMHNTSYPYTVNAPINPGQISNAAQNNTGLLGSAANAFSGIFK